MTSSSNVMQCFDLIQRFNEYFFLFKNPSFLKSKSSCKADIKLIKSIPHTVAQFPRKSSILLFMKITQDVTKDFYETLMIGSYIFSIS